MLSKSEPLMLNDPNMQPNDTTNPKNCLFLNRAFISSEYRPCLVSEQGLAGVGGLSLNHNMTRVRGMRHAKNSNRSKAAKEDFTFSSLALLSTKKGGSRNPTAVPMMLATDSMARATDRLIDENVPIRGETTSLLFWLEH